MNLEFITLMTLRLAILLIFSLGIFNVVLFMVVGILALVVIYFFEAVASIGKSRHR